MAQKEFIMETKEVYIVYEGDQWLSTDSLCVVAVCSDFDSVLDAVECIAVGHGFKYYKELPDDCDIECVEDVRCEFEHCFQYLGSNFGITYEVFQLNEMPYKD